MLVVDDHPIYREGLVALIERQPHLTCCGQLGQAREVLAAVQQTSPDLLLLDLRLGDGDGLGLLPDLHSQFPRLAILVLSQNDEGIYAERALRAGARGYVMKEAATDEVLHAVAAVLAGERYVSPRMSTRLLGELLASERPLQPTGLEALSNRELEVLERLGLGRSTKEIAGELHRSAKTIQAHREHIKRKLGLPGGPALVRYATAWVERLGRG